MGVQETQTPVGVSGSNDILRWSGTVRFGGSVGLIRLEKEIIALRDLVDSNQGVTESRD